MPRSDAPAGMLVYAVRVERCRPALRLRTDSEIAVPILSRQSSASWHQPICAAVIRFPRPHITAPSLCGLSCGGIGAHRTVSISIPHSRQTYCRPLGRTILSLGCCLVRGSRQVALSAYDMDKHPCRLGAAGYIGDGASLLLHRGYYRCRA